MESQPDEGDPTQTAPEVLLKEIEDTATTCRIGMQACIEEMKATLERQELILAKMERNTRRMEILRQTMRPAPPIDPKQDDNRLCAGERAIIAFLKTVQFTSALELVKATGYKPSSLRTWLPMLREKRIVGVDPHQAAIALLPLEAIPDQYHKAIESIPPHGTT